VQINCNLPVNRTECVSATVAIAILLGEPDVSFGNVGQRPTSASMGRTKRQVAAMFAEEQPSLQTLPLGPPFRYYQYGDVNASRLGLHSDPDRAAFVFEMARK
jgi:hypothetical protein